MFGSCSWLPRKYQAFGSASGERRHQRLRCLWPCEVAQRNSWWRTPVDSYPECRKLLENRFNRFITKHIFISNWFHLISIISIMCMHVHVCHKCFWACFLFRTWLLIQLKWGRGPGSGACGHVSGPKLARKRCEFNWIQVNSSEFISLWWFSAPGM